MKTFRITYMTTTGKFRYIKMTAETKNDAKRDFRDRNRYLLIVSVYEINENGVIIE